jgi:hypothetical protein
MSGVRRGTAFLLVAPANTGFFCIAQGKIPLLAESKEKPRRSGAGGLSRSKYGRGCFRIKAMPVAIISLPS